MLFQGVGDPDPGPKDPYHCDDSGLGSVTRAEPFCWFSNKQMKLEKYHYNFQDFFDQKLANIWMWIQFWFRIKNEKWDPNRRISYAPYSHFINDQNCTIFFHSGIHVQLYMYMYTELAFLIKMLMICYNLNVHNALLFRLF